MVISSSLIRYGRCTTQCWLPRASSGAVERVRAYVDLHLLVQAVVEQQVVRHVHAVWLHRVVLSIVEVTDLVCSSRTR